MTAKKRQRARTLVWTAHAEADLEAIADYIARDDPNAARRWVLRLMVKAQAAAKSPFVGRRVPELMRDDIRETLLRSYRLVYRVTATNVVVLTVFEGHRLLRRDRVLEDDE